MKQLHLTRLIILVSENTLIKYLQIILCYQSDACDYSKNKLFKFGPTESLCYLAIINYNISVQSR